MFTSELRRSTFQPILYPETYLVNRAEQKYKSKALHIDNVCLLKYFPKYYKNLKIHPQKNPTFLSSKIKRVKVIRNFLCEHISEERASKYLRDLLQTTRKTLNRLPAYTNKSGWPQMPVQILYLSQYFQRITHLSLVGHFNGRMCLSRSKEKDFEREKGYFWDANRFIKSLEISGYGLSPWMIMRKLNNSKHFLSSLKKLKLKIGGTKSEDREMLCEFSKNKEFLGHVTDLNFYDFPELIRYRDLFEALLKCCTNLKFLSFPVETQDYYLYLDQDFNRSSPLNLNSSLPNLQVLELRTNDLKTFAGGVKLSFPLGVQKVMFNITNWYGQDNFHQAISQNTGKYLTSFFEKWKKLGNLKILDLKLPVFVKVDFLAGNFILPLVRAIPRLETLNCQFRYGESVGGKQERGLDLNAFFKAIEPVKTLKNVRFTKEKVDSEIFTIAYNPEKVPLFPKLSIIEIDTNCSPNFDLNKFLVVFLHDLKFNPGEMDPEKSIKLSRIRLSSVQDLVKLFRVLNTASQFKRLKICLQVDIFVESMEDLTSNFLSPVCVISNVALTLNIYFVFEAFIVLSQEDEEYFEMTFRQMEWSVFKAAKDAIKEDYTQPYNRRLLLGNKK